AKFCARGEVEKGWLRSCALRHSSLDEKRLSSCLRNPRRNGVAAGGAMFIVPLKPSTGCGDVTRASSCDSALRVSPPAEVVIDSSASDFSSDSRVCGSPENPELGSGKYLRSTEE